MEKIIVNADDFGKTHTINLAIAECFNKGLITNTTIMVNMPFADEAVEIAKQEVFLIESDYICKTFYIRSELALL